MELSVKTEPLSPGRPLAWYDLFTLNVNWLGIMSLTQTVTAVIAPLLVQQFVGTDHQGSAFGTLRLIVLMTALLAQAVMGLVSDHTASPLGRRRPFIAAGLLISLGLLWGIGELAGVRAEWAYPLFIVLMILLSVAINTCQAAQQSLIPDLVPGERRGIFSGVKALFEVPLPLILLSLVIGPRIGQGDYPGGIRAIIAVALITLLVTLFLPENRSKPVLPAIDWQPIMRLVVMSGLFIAVILGGKLAFQGVTCLIPEQASLPVILLVAGCSGIIWMALPAALGVWGSIRIGLGPAAADYPAFTAWVIHRLAFFIGSTNLASFLVYYLQARLNLPGESAAQPATLLSMVIGISILISVVPGGWLADRIGKLRLIILSCLLAAAGILLALVTSRLAWIAAGGCLVGIGMGLFTVSNWALGTSLVPPERAGQFLGISNLAGAGAGAIGAFIGGPIADWVNALSPAYPAIGYILLFVIYGAFFLLALIPLFWIRRLGQNPNG